jgi:dTDP-4-amino-4,6-dideoxygalactose transaminase
MFQLIFKTDGDRERASRVLNYNAVMAVPHYVPLHSSPKGSVIGRFGASGLPITDWVSNRLLRLPVYPDVAKNQTRVLNALEAALNTN